MPIVRRSSSAYTPGASSTRVRSGVPSVRRQPMPVLWKPWSVNNASRSPTRWHARSGPCRANSAKPAFSTSLSAVASPPKRQRSKRESPATSVRWYAASAAPMRAADGPRPSKAASNRSAVVGECAMRSIT